MLLKSHNISNPLIVSKHSIFKAGYDNESWFNVVNKIILIKQDKKVNKICTFLNYYQIS